MEVDERGAAALGQAFARHLRRVQNTQSLQVCVGHDARNGSDDLHRSVCKALAADGVDTLAVGLAPTEMISWLVASTGLDGGVVLTASHSPPDIVGMKFILPGARVLHGGALVDLWEASSASPSRGSGNGSIRAVDAREAFRTFLERQITPGALAGMRIVVDAAHGVAGVVLDPLFERLGVETHPLCWLPDGNFPVHGPDPLNPAARALIVDACHSAQAHVGIAWDADADRCVFFDDDSAFVHPAFAAALLAVAILRRHGPGVILQDVRLGRAVSDAVRPEGGRCTLTRVGNPFIKDHMRAASALYGAEGSAHHYFSSFFYADSGLLAALMMLQLTAETDQSLSALLAPMREQYFLSDELTLHPRSPRAAREALQMAYGDPTYHLDGISYVWEDAAFNLRPSLTDGGLRLNVESLVSPSHMAGLTEEVKAVILSAGGPEP